MKNRFEIRGDKVAIFLDRKDGSVMETMIDIEDLNKAQGITGKWFARFSCNNFYAINLSSKKGKVETLRLHRLLTNCAEGMEVDHINHDTLNNTRENLRVVTHIVNMQNLPMRNSNKSGHRGVSWNEERGKWRVTLRLDGKKKYLGRYSDLAQACQIAHQAMLDSMPGYIP
ncbi:HNH endonuclease [Desulfosporosinus sp. OT]|uniref:HNH endonuclease n=1 Tax=Desulfosporosinus sp. OT TaxID=913865 RepID=UPI000223A4F8|nr:HNH endonuclease [Desulfosporosinus sp. OT]EGW36505.1 HNH endonuclease family protein [Desulfosporosinus sp. OT]